MGHIYKIFRAPEWASFLYDGTTAGAPIDLSDGYIHLSTGDQLLETAERHFSGETGLMVLALESAALGDALRWEPSRGGQLFPHLYRKLYLSDLAWARPMGEREGRHTLPRGVV